MSPDGLMFAFEHEGNVVIRNAHGTIDANIPGRGIYFKWSPKSDRLIIGRTDGSADLYEVKVDRTGTRDIVTTRLIIEDIPVSRTRLRELGEVWSQDSSKFIVWDDRAGYHIFDREGIHQRKIDGMQRTSKVWWSPNGMFLLFKQEDHLSVHDYKTGKMTRTFAQEEDLIAGLIWAPDSERVAVLIEESMVYTLLLWNILDDSLRIVHDGDRTGHYHFPKSFHWSPDGNSLAVVFDTIGKIWIYDIRHGTIVVITNNAPYLVRWSSDSNRLTIIKNDSGPVGHTSIHMYDLNSDTTRDVLHVYDMCAHALSNDGRFLYGASRNGSCVAYVGKWTDRMHHLFGRDFKRVIFTLMSVRAMIRDTSVSSRGRTLPLPNLPLEVWLLIFEHVHVAIR